MHEIIAPPNEVRETDSSTFEWEPPALFVLAAMFLLVILVPSAIYASMSCGP